MISRNVTLALMAVGLWALGACSTPDPAMEAGLPSVDTKDCKPEDLSNRLSPFMVDEASSGLRQDLEAVLKTRGIAIVAASCDRGIEVLEGCAVRGEYSFVGLSSQDKTLIMKDKAQASANLGFGVGGGLEAAFSAGRELILQYRLIGKYKTTVPGVVRGQLTSATCQGATHFVTSVDVGAFSSFAAARGSFSASGSYMGQGGSASGESETSNKVSAGNPDACPKSQEQNSETGKPAQDCGASIRVSLTPIVEADSVAALGTGFQISKQTDCRKGFVLNNDDICVPREDAKVFLCDPSNFDECAMMCADPPEGEFSKKSCGYLANLLMRHILEAFEDQATKLGDAEAGDSKKTGRLDILLETVNEDEDDGNPFAFESVIRYGERFRGVCKELADGNTCALATVYELLTIEDPEEEKERFMGLYELIQKGCSAGEQFSCEVMEYILMDKDSAEQWQPMLDAQGVTSRNVEYVKVMTRSCDNGNAFSCFRLSKEHVKGTRAFLDIERAAEYSERSCYGGLSHACIASGAMKLRNGRICNLVLKQYTSETGGTDEDEEAFMDEEDPFAKAMVIDNNFAKLICKKSGRNTETEEIAITDLQNSFELFLTGCELGDKTACVMSEDLYGVVVAQELRRIETQEALRKGVIE